MFSGHIAPIHIWDSASAHPSAQASTPPHLCSRKYSLMGFSGVSPSPARNDGVDCANIPLVMHDSVAAMGATTLLARRDMDSGCGSGQGGGTGRVPPVPCVVNVRTAIPVPCGACQQTLMHLEHTRLLRRRFDALRQHQTLLTTNSLQR